MMSSIPDLTYAEWLALVAEERRGDPAPELRDTYADARRDGGELDDRPEDSRPGETLAPRRIEAHG